MRWLAVWLGALLVVACTAPARPVTNAPALTLVSGSYTQRPDEPWKLTARAEAQASRSSPTGPAATRAPTLNPTARTVGTVSAHLSAGMAYANEGELGLALEEGRQAQALDRNATDVRRFLGTIGPQATATAQMAKTAERLVQGEATWTTILSRARRGEPPICVGAFAAYCEMEQVFMEQAAAATVTAERRRR